PPTPAAKPSSTKPAPAPPQPKSRQTDHQTDTTHSKAPPEPGRRGHSIGLHPHSQRRRHHQAERPRTNDPGYRRPGYVRYCDDWLLGFAGPRREAEQIKARIAAFLRAELKLELSESKTLITHATSQAARFLGYEIKAQHANNKLDRRGQRAVNGAIGLFV